MSTTTAPKQLRTWNAEKAHKYRAAHEDEVIVWHYLLDHSPSMGPWRSQVITAYNQQLRWLQTNASPMSMGQRVLFDDHPAIAPLLALGAMRQLTAQEYDPSQSDGTAIYESMGAALVTQDTPGQHILVLLTDGIDCCRRTAWTLMKCRELLLTLMQERGWVAVGLFVNEEARQVGKDLGFPDDNCLLLHGDNIPDAFRTFQTAMLKYLNASHQERKLLAQHMLT